VFEKVYNGVLANGMSAPGVKGTLFRWAFGLFDEYAEAKAAGRPYQSLSFTLAKKLVFSKVRQGLDEKLGGRIRLFVSGGAPLSPKVAAFFDLLGFDGRDAGFRVVCGGGTYVRVLAADVGTALGCGAHLTALRRTAIGPFDIAEAVPPDAETVPLPIERAVDHLPRIDLETEEAVAAGHGRVLGPAGFEGPYGVFAPGGRLIGVWEDDGPKGRPLVVVPPPDA
jgi:hypothetical protein